jgi:hypothetical protein
MDARSSARDGGAPGCQPRIRSITIASGAGGGHEFAVGIGDREVIGILRLAQVLDVRLLGRDLGTVGLAAGSGFVR